VTGLENHWWLVVTHQAEGTETGKGECCHRHGVARRQLHNRGLTCANIPGLLPQLSAMVGL
jgi:hypothetical protein